MSDKIKVHGIFSNDDELCPYETQIPIWNTIPFNGRGRYVYIDGAHGDQVGR